jgi:protein-S-isoprenylcysteine O-methyltransferase Ste14
MLTRLLAVFRSLLYASGFALFWWWIVVSLRPLDSRIDFSIPQFLRIPGLVIAVFGVTLGLWCVGAFAIVGKGTPAPFDAPRQFVAVGPYRYVRNPMYVGALAVIFGAGLILRSPAAFLVAVLFATLGHLFVLAYEEPTLEKRFGQSYLQYKRSVNRWLPRTPKRIGF